MLNMTEEVGKYFGYPMCCIKAYEEMQSKGGKKTPEQAFIASQHEGGFMPCPEHAKQVLEGSATLVSLISNRICPTPFPEEPPIEVIDEYLTANAV